MARNLELRSTYLYNEGGIGTISITKPEPSLQDTSSTVLNKSTFTENTHLHKKNEYSVAMSMCKTIRDGLDDELSEIIEPHCSKKLTSRIRNGLDGSGTLKISDAKNELENFNFNSRNSFSKGEGTKYFIRKGAHRGHIILHIPAFIPVKALNVPEDATNFKLSSRLIALSDFNYNTDIGAYTPEVLDNHGKFGKYESSMLPLLRIQTQPLTAQISINRGRTLNEGMGTILILAVKFFKYSQGKFTHLPDDGIMQILKVF